MLTETLEVIKIVHFLINTILHFQMTGSDTIVTHDGRIFEKPADTEDAVRLKSFEILCALCTAKSCALCTVHEAITYKTSESSQH